MTNIPTRVCFAVTAGMFGALAIFGSTTKRSLAGAAQLFYMGVIGLVLASLLRLFWHSYALEFLISVVGVIVFTGLTAWDAQRLMQMATGPQGGFSSCSASRRPPDLIPAQNADRSRF